MYVLVEKKVNISSLSIVYKKCAAQVYVNLRNLIKIREKYQFTVTLKLAMTQNI